jgi:hypothetical protein
MFNKILKKRNVYLKSITKIVKIFKSSKEYGWYNNSIGLKLEVFNGNTLLLNIKYLVIILTKDLF